MNRNTRFAVAVHCLLLLHQSPDGGQSSDRMAASVGTNASFIRRIMAMLSKAGLIQSAPGIPGGRLAKPAGSITLLEVYRAVGMEDDHRLAIHSSPHPACDVGRNIESALKSALHGAESAFESELQRQSLAQVWDSVSQAPA